MNRKYLIGTVYLTAICLANLSVAVFGPASSIVNSFFFIGLDMVLRDKMHEQIGLLKMGVLAAIAGAISYVLNPSSGAIAIASVAAFVIAALVDGVAYQLLIKRSWITRTNGSNLFAAAADSLVFPTIAFGSLMPIVVLGQFAAKMAGGALWSVLLKGRRN